jgi:eukaryotic-like serine/threonine-protein kinase
MSEAAVNRDLLFGILVLQNNFISREALLSAFALWVTGLRRPLGEILCEQGQLTHSQNVLLLALTDEHVKQHNNDPEQSLAAISEVDSLCDDLRKLNDPQLQASLEAIVRQPSSDPCISGISSTCIWDGEGARFRVLRPHAKGGLGEVFVAQDLELHREVALKEIQSRYANQPTSRSRFIMEAEITGGLEHPGIVPVYGLGQYADGRPFYAMRFIRGNNLGEAIARFHKSDVSGRSRGDRCLELRKLLGRFIDVCEAIEYAHSRGVLHRDLKPGNIMLGKFGETLVVDWGLAKAVGRGENAEEIGETTLQPSSGDSIDRTIPGQAIGTPAYMSPEQAAGRLQDLGPASDVYSLGATLYCLLTGKPPFSGNDKGEILRQVARGDFLSPRNVKAETPIALQAICLKAMSLKPIDRFASPRMLADDVEHWLADEPVSCLKESSVDQVRRWVRRHPTLVVGSVATVFISLLSLSVVATIIGQTNRTLEWKNLELTEAKKHADQERQYAEKSRDETKQAFDFLIATFQKPDPSQDGEKITVVEMFDQATNQLNTAFPKNPILQSRLLNAIGGTYLGLGTYQKALAVFERSLELRREELGEFHEDTLESMNNLALALEMAGRTKEALPIFEKTLERVKVNQGPEQKSNLALLNNLALAYRSEGRLADAIKLYEQALELAKANLKEDDPEALRAMSNLASAYEAADRLEESLELKEKTLKKRQIILSQNHPDTLRSMNSLAGAYESAGRLDEAIGLYEKTLELRKNKLGLDHPDTLISMNNLAYSYSAAGRDVEALPVYEQTLELKKAKLGLDHPSTLNSMNNLAGSYKSVERLADSVGLYEKTLEMYTAKVGRSHPDTLGVMGNLADVYLRNNQPEKALPLFEEFVQGQRERSDPRDPRFAGLLAAVSHVLLQHQQFANAESYLRESLSIRAEKAENDWSLFDTKSMLGNALSGQNKLPEAEPLLVEGYQGLKERESHIPISEKPHLIEAIQRLIDLYTVWEKPNEVSKWQEELRTAKSVTSTSSDPK